MSSSLMQQQTNSTLSTSTGKSPASSLKLDSSPELGRYFVASKHVKPGEVVMKEFPMAVAPGPMSEHVCFGCHRFFSQAYLCRTCNSPLCSADCQRSNEHQRDCQYLRKIFPHSEKKKKVNKANGQAAEQEKQQAPLKLSLLMLPLRLLLLRLQQPEKWQLLLDLESHMEARRTTPVWGFIERNIFPYLKTMLADCMPDLTSELVQQVCGAIDVNSFEIRIDNDCNKRMDMAQPTLNSREVLRGTFYMASLMAHSCVVNVQISIGNDTQMIVKATTPIKEGEGVFVTYTDPLQTTLQRRNFLAKGKYFTCRCRRCQEPDELGTYASALRCPSCPGGFILPHDVKPSSSTLSNRPLTAAELLALRFHCNECEREMSVEDVSRTEEVVQNIIKNIQRLPVDRHLMDRCEELFVTLPKKLHSSHALLMQLRIFLVHLYGNIKGYLMTELSSDQLLRKTQLCFDLLKGLDHICPGYSRLRGISLYEVHAPLVVISSRKFENGHIDHNQLIRDLRDAERYLKEAVEILIHEPMGSPESRIAKAAMADLKQLRDYIRDMEQLKAMNVFEGKTVS